MVGVMKMVPAIFDRCRMVLWALAVYWFVWIGSLQGLFLVSLIPDGPHQAIVSATSNQLRLVLHHHGYQDEHHTADHADDGASSGTFGDVPPDHDVSMVDPGEQATTSGPSGLAHLAKTQAVAPLATVDESPRLHLRTDQIDPYQFVLSPTLRSHRAIVLLI